MGAVRRGAVRGATTGRCPATRMMRLPAAGAGIAKFERDEKCSQQLPPDDAIGFVDSRKACRIW